MLTTAAAPRRTDLLMYLIGIALSVPPLISLIHRQWAVPMAGDVDQIIIGYRALSDTVAQVIHAPLKAIQLPPPPPLIDLHILSFAGMGMMSRGIESGGEKPDAVKAATWTIMSFVLAYLLAGILVLGGTLAMLIARPLLPFRSDHYIETTPVLEGPRGRLRREREMRLERELTRILLISICLTGGYFALNALLMTH